MTEIEQAGERPHHTRRELSLAATLVILGGLIAGCVLMQWWVAVGVLATGAGVGVAIGRRIGGT